MTARRPKQTRRPDRRWPAQRAPPTTYPLDCRGKIIAHRVCQPIGQLAWDAGEQGIACRPATRGAPPNGEELAYFGRETLLVRVEAGATRGTRAARLPAR